MESRPKTGLPSGCTQILELCADDEPHPLFGGDVNVATVLAALGYLELLPGCKNTWGITEKGERYLADAG